MGDPFNREKLFTFLRHDGVPWNNNNSEHAIKSFTLYRKITNECFTGIGMEKYLILLSIYQTCQYRNIDFLGSIKSGELDLFK